MSPGSNEGCVEPWTASTISSDWNVISPTVPSTYNGSDRRTGRPARRCSSADRAVRVDSARTSSVCRSRKPPAAFGSVGVVRNLTKLSAGRSSGPLRRIRGTAGTT